MIKDILLEMYERELQALKNEISLYTHESDLWVTQAGISNSAGNLCLHLIGNLHHFIGATLGQTGYVREREKEFSEKNVPRQDLLQAIDGTLEMIKKVLGNMPADALADVYPVEKNGRVLTNNHILLHLLAHLNYHLGQINYHRRLLARGDNTLPL